MGYLSRGVGACFLVVGLWGATAHATPSALFAVGDSLSDTGNISLNSGITSLPIPGDAFIPSQPYNRGATLLPAFSNGPTWLENLAFELDLPPQIPSLAGGSNFAFGGARMRPGVNMVPSIRDQVDTLLFRDSALPSDALYVVWGGGNDALDAFGSPGAALDIIDAYGDTLDSVIRDLVGAGAQQVLIPNVPDLSLTPALQSIGDLGVLAEARSLSSAFNETYASTLDLLDLELDAELLRFDVFGLVADIVANPDAFDLVNTANACAADPSCDPAEWLSWDGIHPTAAGHQILAEEALSLLLVPEPATWLGLVPGLLLVVCARRRIDSLGSAHA